MNQTDQPFAQMDIKHVIDALPMLKGCACQVWVMIGAFEGDPIGPSVKDICSYLHLSRPSVSGALEFLCKHELALCFEDEEGVRRYRANEEYFRYRGSGPVSVRAMVPVSGKDSNVNNSFTSLMDGTSSIQEDNQKLLGMEIPSIHALEKIFSDVVDPPSVPEFAKLTESDEQARAWVSFMETNPLRKATPVGWSLWYLRKHPKRFPPGYKPERKRQFHAQGPIADQLGFVTKDEESNL